MCVFTDGCKDDLRVSNTTELYRAALELFNNYNPARHLSDAAISNTHEVNTKFSSDCIGKDAALSTPANRLPKGITKNVAY